MVVSISGWNTVNIMATQGPDAEGLVVGAGPGDLRRLESARAGHKVEV
jgi:hypothetical protein